MQKRSMGISVYKEVDGFIKEFNEKTQKREEKLVKWDSIVESIREVASGNEAQGCLGD